MKLVVEEVNHPIPQTAKLKLSIARADLLHPLASGNKIYKLTPHLKFAKQQKFKQLLSFGGAFSNHIHALALTAQSQGLSSIGIIRGESAYAKNPTLQDAQSAGMRLEFVDRVTYKRRQDSDYLKQLQMRYPEALIIPEGGSSQLAIQGCRCLATDINALQGSDILTVSCGTGATLSGIICGLNIGQTAIGYAVLKDDSLQQRVQKFVSIEKASENGSYRIEKAAFGGYAKLDKTLLDFILDFLDKTGILLDPIYTSKMSMRLMQQIEAGEFKSGTSITLIHSGGLQGWRGMQKRVIQLAGEENWKKIALQLRSSC